MAERVGAVIAGAQKCATTTLFAMLQRVPGIVTSRKKEADFFSTHPDWQNGLDEYHSLFGSTDGCRLEASPSYTMYPHKKLAVWEDIKAYNPDMRIIYIVRPPLERMRSAYKHTFERGYTKAGYEDFLLTNSLAIDTSRYAMQIEPFLETFGSEKVLLLRFREVVGEPERTIGRVTEFLRLPRADVPSGPAPHANDSKQRKYHHMFDEPGAGARLLRRLSWRAYSAYRDFKSQTLSEPPHASLEIERAFLDLVENDIRRFETLTGWNLSEWRTQ